MTIGTLAPHGSRAALGPDTPQNDLRTFLSVVEAHGELATIPGAHWDKELGAVTEVLYRQKVEKSPLLVFDDIPGYPHGYRCAYGFFGSPYRLGLVLGMETELADNRKAQLDYFRKNIKKAYKQIPPTIVPDGPVCENVLSGDDVDVLRFPGSDPPRARRRPLHRDGLRRRHARSRHRSHQRRDLSRDGQRRQNAGFVHLERQARPHHARQVSQGGQAVPGRDHRGDRPDHLSWPRPTRWPTRSPSTTGAAASWTARWS